VLSAAFARDRDEEGRETVEARKLVLGLVKAVEDGKDDKALAAKAEAIRKKDVDLNQLMKVYKRRGKGGLGYGDKPDPKSGLEAKIIALQRTERGPSKETLRKEKKDLIRLANVNVAMAEIARPHSDAYTNRKKEWDRWLDEQKAAAKDLIAAVEQEDGKAVAKAAKDLLAACTECHSIGQNGR